MILQSTVSMGWDWFLVIPAFVFVVGLCVVLRRRFGRSTSDSRRCPECGFRLPGISSPRCPACGESIQHDISSPRRRGAVIPTAVTPRPGGFAFVILVVGWSA